MDKITVTATLQPGRPARVTLSLSCSPDTVAHTVGELVDHAQAIVSQIGHRGRDYSDYPPA